MIANTEYDLWIKEAFKASLRDGPAAYQLVGGVTAYQGDDTQPN